MPVTKSEIEKYEGFRYAQKNPLTGNWLLVCKSVDQGTVGEKGKWVTICEEHNMTSTHAKLGIARMHAKYPEWCEGCQQILKEKSHIKHSIKGTTKTNV